MYELFDLLKKDELFLNEDKVLVAFSGGPDSIFVFKLLDGFRKIKNFKIHLYHLNHNLRESAKKDEAFVKDFAIVNKCTLHLESVDINNFASDLGVGLEEAGRIKRYEALKEIAKKIGTKTVITGHHFDDDVETMLMNFNRGTGLNGISGIKSREGIYFRPLLSISKSFIMEYLNENNIKYCVDETNFSDDVKRNDIRLNLIPKLKESFNDFYRSSKILLDNLKSTQLMIEDVFEKFLRESELNDNFIKISITKMLDYFPRSRGDLYLYIIKKLNQSKKDIYSYHINMIDEIIHSKEEKRLSFSGIEIIKSYDDLIFTNVDYNDRNMKFELIDNYIKDCIEIDKDKIAGEVVIKKRENGDVFETKGGRSKKLKELLIDEKIPKYKRDNLVVIRDDLGIIYVEGLWLSRRVKTDDKTKNKIYLRRYYE